MDTERARTLAYLVIIYFTHCIRQIYGDDFEEACVFPEKWSGKWFQSGILQPILIDGQSIDVKGDCVQRHGFKYIVKDPREDCYRCLVIHERHQNVLQYKESYCLPNGMKDLSTLCSQISGDANLYHMFRMDGEPIDCPLKHGPPFNFTYNRGSGECRSPVSIVDACTDSYRMLFRYQACPSVINSESMVEEMTCWATWRDGSTKYLVSKLESRMVASEEDRYRCYVYTKSNDEYDVAQSGDATCNGVYSATEGSRTMHLVKATNSHQVKALCKMPVWSSASWRNLNQSKSYHFYSDNGTLIVSAENPEMRVTCVSILEDRDGYFRFKAHVTQGCRSGYKCMIIHKRDDQIIELQMSAESAFTAEDACIGRTNVNSSTPFITLITSSLKPHKCPFKAKYTVSGGASWRAAAASHLVIDSSAQQSEGGAKRCQDNSDRQILNQGCNNLHTMEFQSECTNDIAAAFTCHGDWLENGTTYTVVTPMSHTSEREERYCVAMDEERSTSNSKNTPSASTSAYNMHLSSLSRSCVRNFNAEHPDLNWEMNITIFAECDGMMSAGRTLVVNGLFVFAVFVSLVA